MNKFILFLGIFLLGSILFSSCKKDEDTPPDDTPDNSNWTRQQDDTNHVTIKGIHFLDANNGIAVGGKNWTDAGGLTRQKGRVYYTSNGGTNWTLSISAIPLYTIHSIFSTDATHAWGTGQYGRIIFSSDGGQTWTEQIEGSSGGPSTMSIRDIFFIDANIGWAAAGGQGSGSSYIGQVLKTTNGGSTWTVVFEDLDYFSLNSIHFVDNMNGYAAGGVYENHGIIKTTDGGTTWTELYTTTSADIRINAIYAFDANTAITCGTGTNAGMSLKTTDGGTTWTEFVQANNFIGWKMSFYDSMNGWMAGQSNEGNDGPVVLKTVDGGESWTYDEAFDYESDSQASTFFGRFVGVFALDNGNIWVGGDMGSIFKKK